MPRRRSDWSKRRGEKRCSSPAISDHRDIAAKSSTPLSRTATGAPPTQASLPKGLSPETAEAVLDALRGTVELSAGECADLVGISRVSARRYLEHFVARGTAVVRLQYGGAGRPERRYRPAG